MGLMILWNFFNLALLALLTFYIYQKSPVALTLMFIYYLSATLSLWFVDLTPKDLILDASFTVNKRNKLIIQKQNSLLFSVHHIISNSFLPIIWAL